MILATLRVLAVLRNKWWLCWLTSEQSQSNSWLSQAVAVAKGALKKVILCRNISFTALPNRATPIARR